MSSCPYCHGQVLLTTGEEIYPHRRDLYHKKFYICRPCNAYVGCHDGTTVALGPVANMTLRNIRKRAHAAFDPIWKDGLMTRKGAYAG